MTKRIKQHQLEDTSRNKFALSIPREWVFRDKDKDYGIDGEVEIFNEKGKPTGLVFWVQLKATESKKLSTINAIDLKLETLHYYKGLDIPVLIARYSAFQDKFYVQWTNQVDTHNSNDHAKTKRINFSDINELNDAKSIELCNYLSKLRLLKSGSLNLPVGIKLSFSKTKLFGMAAGIFRTKLLSAAQEYENILYIEDDKDSLFFDAHFDDISLKVGILDSFGCVLDSINSIDPLDFIETSIKNICLSIAIIFNQLGFHDIAAKIVFQSTPNLKSEISHEMLIHLLPGLLKSNHFNETIELVNVACNETDNTIIEGITHALLLYFRGNNDKTRLASIESFLIQNVKRYERIRNNSYGIALYNLANFYRHRNRPKESIKNYLKARKYEPKYYKQDYFWGEAAGVLFLLNKFSLAAAFYKKAIEIGAPERWQPLYADALMLSGKYQESLTEFESSLESSVNHPSEWILKSYCLTFIINNFQIHSQSRQIQAALAQLDFDHVEGSEIQSKCFNALKEDLLCTSAWFNLGTYKSRQGENGEAYICFAICALIDQGDVEAWINATLCSFSRETDLLFHTLSAGYAVNGNAFISDLYEQIKNTFNEETSTTMISLLDSIVMEEKKLQPPSELRVLNEDGKFVNILDNHQINTKK